MHQESCQRRTETELTQRAPKGFSPFVIISANVFGVEGLRDANQCWGFMFCVYIYKYISKKPERTCYKVVICLCGQMLVLHEEVNPQNREGKSLSYCKLCWKCFSFSCIFIDFKRPRGKHQYKPIQRPVNSVFNSRSLLSTVSHYTRAGFFSPVLQQHKQGWMLL